jgi:FtsH-binding integral membrane protein
MMKTSLAVGIWLYLVIATVIEVALFKVGPPGTIDIDIVIGVVAAISAIVTALFSMNIREEPTAVQYLFLIPVLLVGVLIITLVLSFPIIQ